ncbi:MAG: prepilin-type N-terminal cleavage/methylation domain-containing protein [Victivallaceae bacterium]
MRNRRNPFTLIELLVVIAIIAILASMLLPSLNKAREKALAVKCVSQQKQVALAVGFYLQQSNDVFYAPNSNNTSDPKVTGTHCTWAAMLYWEGLLPKSSVLLCPAFKNYNLGANAWGALNQSYGAIYVNSSPYLFNFKNAAYQKSPGPSRIAYAGCSYSVGQKSPMSRMIFWASGATPSTSESYGRPWLAHNDRANMLFMDGHVSPVARANGTVMSTSYGSSGALLPVNQFALADGTAYLTP